MDPRTNYWDTTRGPRDLWDKLFAKTCRNCHHPIKTNRDRGMPVEPDKTFHWIENYGSKQCPACACDKPEA